MTDPKKPFREIPEDKRQTDERRDADKKDVDAAEVDEVIDKASYTERKHGRTHDRSTDVNNPGTA